MLHIFFLMTLTRLWPLPKHSLFGFLKYSLFGRVSAGMVVESGPPSPFPPALPQAAPTSSATQGSSQMALHWLWEASKARASISRPVKRKVPGAPSSSSPLYLSGYVCCRNTTSFLGERETFQTSFCAPLF